MTSDRHTPAVDAGRSPPPGGGGLGGRAKPITRRARALRKNMTKAEGALWRLLRRDALGVRFRRQFAFHDRYVLDFFAPRARLAVEIDGGQHGVNVSADARRTRFLNDRGVSVLRFCNNEVLSNVEGVVFSIDAVVRRLLGGPSPLIPLQGEGESARRDVRMKLDGLRLSLAEGRA